MITKRSIITLLLALFAYLPSMANTSAKEAEALVKKYVSETLSNPTICVIYSVPDNLSKIDIYYRKSVDVRTSTWKFIVDPNPNLGMVHTANIVLVSKTTGKITTKTIDMQPKIDKNWKVIYDPSSFFDIGGVSEGRNGGNGDDVYLEFDGISYNNNYQNLGNMFGTKIKNSPNSYAVIISGGINTYNNWIRYWNDCSFVYQMLVDRYGYKKENIYILMAGGKDPAWENHYWLVGTPNFGFGAGKNYDLDNDGQEENIYPATNEYINQIFNNLSTKISNKNDLFIFSTDHGDSDGSMMLWNEEKISTSEFALQLNKVSQAKSISVLMGQCFSGAFVESLQGDNRIICTAANSQESSYATPRLESPYWKVNLYDEFVYKWIKAHKNLDSDINGDGKVSMLEAFKYAYANDIFVGDGYYLDGYLLIEHPQYWSDLCLGEHTFLGGGPEEYLLDQQIVFNNPVSSGSVVKKASVKIESKSVITGGDVKFYAGSSVILKYPFSVSNAGFLADISDNLCDDSENVVDPSINPSPYMPYMVEDNNLSDLEDETLAVKSISIYPNPTTGDLTIALGENVANVTITDVIGKVISSQKASGDLFVDVSSYNTGIYLVNIVTENDSYTEKVVLK